jgi:hypothetical protein
MVDTNSMQAEPNMNKFSFISDYHCWAIGQYGGKETAKYACHLLRCCPLTRDFQLKLTEP